LFVFGTCLCLDLRSLSIVFINRLCATVYVFQVLEVVKSIFFQAILPAMYCSQSLSLVTTLGFDSPAAPVYSNGPLNGDVDGDIFAEPLPSQSPSLWDGFDSPPTYDVTYGVPIGECFVRCCLCLFLVWFGLLVVALMFW
jgi:hypothetical protein